jgi:hypothetical protein
MGTTTYSSAVNDSTAYGTTTVYYNGATANALAASGYSLAPIYLRDVGARNQLGGGLGIYHKGQDQYINYHPGYADGTVTLLSTADVVLSTMDSTRGVIGRNLANGYFTVAITTPA